MADQSPGNRHHDQSAAERVERGRAAGRARPAAPGTFRRWPRHQPGLGGQAQPAGAAGRPCQRPHRPDRARCPDPPPRPAHLRAPAHDGAGDGGALRAGHGLRLARRRRRSAATFRARSSSIRRRSTTAASWRSNWARRNWPTSWNRATQSCIRRRRSTASRRSRAAYAWPRSPGCTAGSPTASSANCWCNWTRRARWRCAVPATRACRCCWNRCGPTCSGCGPTPESPATSAHLRR